MTDRKLGSELCDIDRELALRVFVDRFTGDTHPPWARRPRPDGSHYMPHFRDDAEWLARSWFQVRRDGRLDLRARSCESCPTWPEGRDNWR